MPAIAKNIPRPRRESGTWQRRAEHRAAEILAAARALLEQRGYAGVSMAKISRRAGVSEATLYKYFDNRQDLLNRVLQEWALPFIEDLEREISLVSGLRAKLTLIAIRYLRGMEQTPRLHRVVFQEVRWNDYAGSPLHQANQRFAGMAVNAVEEAIGTGEAGTHTSAVMVRDMLFGGLEHVAQRTIFADRPINIGTEAATLANLLVDGIAPRGVATPDAEEDVTRLVSRLQRAIESLRASPGKSRID